MKEKLSRAEVLKLLGPYAHELSIVEEQVSKNSPSASMCHPDSGETIWVVRKGAVITYERYLP